MVREGSDLEVNHGHILSAAATADYCKKRRSGVRRLRRAAKTVYFV